MMLAWARCAKSIGCGRGAMLLGSAWVLLATLGATQSSCGSDEPAEPTSASATASGSGAGGGDGGTTSVGGSDPGGGGAMLGAERHCNDIGLDGIVGDTAELAYPNRSVDELSFVQVLIHLWESPGPGFSDFDREVLSPVLLGDGFVAVACDPRLGLSAMAGDPYVTFVDLPTPEVDIAEESCSTTLYSTEGTFEPMVVAEHAYPGKTKEELASVRVIAHRQRPLATSDDAQYFDARQGLVLVRDGFVAVRCLENVGGDTVRFLMPVNRPAAEISTLPCTEKFNVKAYPGRSQEELSALQAIGHWDLPLASTMPGGGDAYHDQVLGYVLVRDEEAAAECITESGKGAPQSVTLVWQPP